MSIIKSLKLHNGELIACTLEADYELSDFEQEKYITLHDPVVYASFKFLDPQTDQVVDTISMAPYNAVTEDRAIIISTSIIQSVGNMRQGAQQRYENFVRQLDKYNQVGDQILQEQEQQEDSSDNMVELLTAIPDGKFYH